MTIQKALSDVGLNDSEVAIYLYLLSNGPSTPTQIAKGTGIARTNGHHILRSLQEKGLVVRQAKGRRTTYLAKDPAATRALLEQRLEALDEALPDLRALHVSTTNKPSIRFYEGWNEVKEIYMQTLEADELHTIASTEHMVEQDPKFFVQYQKLLKKHGVADNDILAGSSRGKTAKKMKEILEPLYKQRFFPKSQKDLPTDIFVWDDRVALISFEPVFGTVIVNAALAETFRAVFKLAWKAAER